MREVAIDKKVTVKEKNLPLKKYTTKSGEVIYRDSRGRQVQKVETDIEVKPKQIKNLDNEIKEALKMVLTNQLAFLEADLKAMKPERKWETWCSIAKFVFPVLAQTKVDADVESNMNISVSFGDLEK